MQKAEEKLFFALSLCKKAGRLTPGFEAAAESVLKGSAALVLLAADVSEGTEKRVRRLCEGLAPCEKMPLTQQDLCAITKKKVGVYAVNDGQLAVLCRRSLDSDKEDNA